MTACKDKNHDVNGYIPHNHPYISSSEIMWYLPCDCYILGIVKHRHLHCGFCLCTLSTSNTVIPCMQTSLASSFIHPSLHLLDFWSELSFIPGFSGCRAGKQTKESLVQCAHVPNFLENLLNKHIL